jgi:hypothetical protein
MQTAFTLPLQSGRLKENQGAVAQRTAMKALRLCLLRPHDPPWL